MYTYYIYKLQADFFLYKIHKSSCDLLTENFLHLLHYFFQQEIHKSSCAFFNENFSHILVNIFQQEVHKYFQFNLVSLKFEIMRRNFFP